MMPCIIGPVKHLSTNCYEELGVAKFFTKILVVDFA